MTVTAVFARFAATARPSPEALHMMRLSLFDWAVCGIAGRDEPVARIVRGMVLAEGGAGRATVFGSATRLPARAAALANGTASHALDYDDTHFAHIGHPSVAVIPAALALAQQQGADAAAFLDACTTGAELSVRLGTWLGRAHYDAGFHQTATAGTFGATAAAGRLLGLDAAGMAQALGLAATRAAGLKSQFGTMGKPYHAGAAAAAGVEAATLAAAGFISRSDGLDCAQGFGSTHAGAGDAAALEGIGETWLFPGVTHKFHACCHGTHAAIEALRQLAPDVAGEVTGVEVRVHPSWLKVCDVKRPETGLEAKFSLTLTAAMALDGTDTADLAVFSAATCRDPALVALRGRVGVAGDPALPITAARTAVTLADGRRLVAEHDLCAPIPVAERTEKLRGKARALLGGAASEALWQATAAAPAPDLGRLAACIATEAAQEHAPA